MPDSATSFAVRCRAAGELACSNDLAAARTLYDELQRDADTPARQSLIRSGLAALDALAGDMHNAVAGFLEALRLDADCACAKANLALLEGNGFHTAQFTNDPASIEVLEDRTKVAILSLLFNWPSTGGGTVHTAETARFLFQAGYDVRHIYARYPAWGIGRVEEGLGVPAEPIDFDDANWEAEEIRSRFREAVDAFGPDYVLITDSWNSKRLLAEAAQGYRYVIRLAALECLCPLNNVRLLVGEQGEAIQCPRHQLATPGACRTCVQENERFSGGLHRAERALAGYGNGVYKQRLVSAIGDAEAVLVVNPLIAEMVRPYAKQVLVVPSGFDPARFPWPLPDTNPGSHDHITRLFFAGLTAEFMKGFRVLQAACDVLWQRRQDFELIVTADPPERPEPYTRYIGWQSQAELPRRLCEADVLVFPTIAQEALGRSAVEAMGAGKPVIASRIGGLPFTVVDGLTGLLFEPGDAADLARKIETLLDSPELRQQMGLAGRRRFEELFTWDVVLPHYFNLFGAPVRNHRGHDREVK